MNGRWYVSWLISIGMFDRNLNAERNLSGEKPAKEQKLPACSGVLWLPPLAQLGLLAFQRRSSNADGD
jgi:hypothetical protein